MRVVVQKVLNASCSIDNKLYSKIDNGLVLFVGFTDGDDIDKIKWMVNKVVNLRVFEDSNNIMNLSVKDVGGSILSISQFTLYGDANKGNRPSYIKALGGEEASMLYDLFNEELEKTGILLKTGKFKSDMKISLINDGPTTILLER